MNEPLLETDDIQGNVVPGFNTDVMRVLGFNLGEDTRPDEVRTWLGRLAGWTTTAEDLARARAERTPERKPETGRLERSPAEHDLQPYVNVCLSYRGLQRLGVEDAGDIHDAWFKRGMPALAGRLGDAPAAYETPDVLVIVGADTDERVSTRCDELLAATPGRMRATALDRTGRRLADQREHFGFRDGIANPVVRGRLRDGAFLHPRAGSPEAAFAGPGRPLVWPGQALFGYPGQDARRLLEPGAEVSGGPRWMRNGSLLVLRVFRQDVQAFRRFTARAAAALDVSEARAAAMLVGRWPNGTPLRRYPEHPGSPQPDADNDFGYRRKDLDGGKCPLAAHIRKVNPRDAPTDSGDLPGTLAKQIFRRGIPWGVPYEEDAQADRGMLFLAYATDLERRFGALAAWMDHHDGPEGLAGPDLFAGAANGAPRTAMLPGVRGPVAVTATERWVAAIGGGFYFSPSVSLLEVLATRRA